MPRSFSFTLGGSNLPFSRGLNTAKRPAELAPNEAQVADSVDLSSGTIRGAWGLGTAIAQTVPVNSKFICCASGTDWISSTDPDTACRINHYTVAYTKIAGGSYDYPRAHQSATSARLGVPAPASGMTATGGARPNRSYALVYADLAITYPYPSDNPYAYSNPSPIVSSGNSGATLGSIPGSAGTFSRFIFATVEGDPNGTLYLYKSLSSGLTSWTDTGGDYGAYAVNEDFPLNWGANGNIDSETTPFDFSPANPLSCLAEEMYAPAGADSGVMFGVMASNNQIYVAWSHAGRPWAWPMAFQHNLQETVHALVTWRNAVFALTEVGAWSFSGAADYAIAPERISGVHPIRKGFGKTAKATPWGIVYVAREGLAVFDGLTSRIITKGVLDLETWLSGTTYANAVYYDGAYRLNLWGANTVLVVELGDGVKVTTMPLDVAEMHVAPRATSQPGLFVADKTTGALHPWRPADGSAVPGAVRSDDWEWKTPLLTLDEPSRPKTFRRVRLSGRDLSITFSVGDDLTLAAGSTYARTHTHVTTGDSQQFWLPAGFIGKALRVDVTATSADAELHEMTIEGSVLNGA